MPPLSVHPDNPRYFLFRGRPAVLVTSGEHYGAVLNLDFDYERYLAALAADGPIRLVVDDTLLHKRGEHVYGLGWFYDAVASTETRPVTAPGNNWAVVGIVVPVPGEPNRFLCLPLQARLHLAGDEHPSCPDLAALMVQEIVSWFPGRE